MPGHPGGSRRARGPAECSAVRHSAAEPVKLAVAERQAISQRPPGLATILREWGRIGCIGFGGPPTHIALLRQLCVEQHRWLDAAEFEDAIAACNLLPGPASTQLAIFCAWRLRGRPARWWAQSGSSSPDWS